MRNIQNETKSKQSTEMDVVKTTEHSEQKKQSIETPKEPEPINIDKTQNVELDDELLVDVNGVKWDDSVNWICVVFGAEVAEIAEIVEVVMIQESQHVLYDGFDFLD